MAIITLYLVYFISMLYCSGQKMTLTGWHHVSKPPATPYPPGASSNHTQVVRHPKDASTSTALMLCVIPELPPFRKLQLRARQPRQQIIPDLHRLLHSLIFSRVHNVSHPPAWIVMDRGGFSCMQSQQLSAGNYGHYNKSILADHALTRITPVPSASRHID